MTKKLSLLFLLSPLSAEIVVDGKLNEIEWDSAGIINTFFVTEPLTYETPEVETEVLYFANEDGIYFGFKNYEQPIEDQTTLLHKRDVMDASEMLVCAADHGLTAEGISAYPSDVTWQMVENFLAGGAAVSVLSKQNNISLNVVDCGVRHDFSPREGLIIQKVSNGTANSLYEPAMSNEECQKAMNNGMNINLNLPDMLYSLEKWE